MARAERRKKILAIEFLRELEGKVSEEIRKRVLSDPALSDIAQATIYDRSGPNAVVLSDSRQQLLETMQEAFFVGIGSAMLSEYAKADILVDKKGYIGSLLDVAATGLVARESNLESGSYFDMPQMSDRDLTSALQDAGHVGMSVRTQPGVMSEEDFRFGGYAPGVSVRSINEIYDDVGRARESEREESRRQRFERRYGDIARRRYNARDKTPEEILATLPRKYEIRNQTYVLDITRTLSEGGIDEISPGYGLILTALESEKDDPVKQDELNKMYAQIEIGAEEPAEADD